MKSTLIIANFGAAFTTLLGLLGLCFPAKAASLVSICPIGLNGRSEIRATYGGLFTAMGVYCFVSQTELVFFVSGVAWLGASFGRLCSVLIDRNYDIKNIAGFAIESSIGFLLIFPKCFAHHFT